MSNQLTHSRKHGGLMQKSIGSIYPLAVSQLGCGLWYVWNTETSNVSLTFYTDVHEAHRYAEWVTSEGVLSAGATSDRTVAEVFQDVEDYGDESVGTVNLKTGVKISLYEFLEGNYES